MMRRVVCCLGLLCSLCVMGDRATEAAQTGGGPSNDATLDTSAEGNVLRGVLTIYMWKMTDAVGLTEEQAAQVFPKIREAFRTRWQSAARRQYLLRFLEREIDSLSKHEHALKRFLSQWEENETRRRGAQQEMQTVLTEVLTPEQQAKSLLFEEQFQGNLIQVIRDIRRERLERSGESQPGQEP